MSTSKKDRRERHGGYPRVGYARPKIGKKERTPDNSIIFWAVSPPLPSPPLPAPFRSQTEPEVGSLFTWHEKKVSVVRFWAQIYHQAWRDTLQGAKDTTQKKGCPTGFASFLPLAFPPPCLLASRLFASHPISAFSPLVSSPLCLFASHRFTSRCIITRRRRYRRYAGIIAHEVS